MKAKNPLLAQALRFRCGIEALEARIAPATILVQTLADSGPGSLRAAIDQANASAGEDTLEFTKTGVIKLHSDLPAITDDLILNPTKTVTIDGNKVAQIFSVTGAGTDVKFTNISLKNGVSDMQGGALFVDSEGGTVSISKATISGNVNRGTAELVANGGAITIAAGTVTIDSSTFSKNVAGTGAGEFTSQSAQGGAIANSGTLTITNSTFKKNIATAVEASGGAIHNAFEATLTVESSKFLNNKAQGISGVAGSNGLKGARGPSAEPGSFSEDGSNGDIGEDGTEGSNGGNASGGAIFNSGSLLLKSSLITGNAAVGGKGGNGGKGGDGGGGGAGSPRTVEKYDSGGYGGAYRTASAYGGDYYGGDGYGDPPTQIVHPAGKRGLGGSGGNGANGGNGGEGIGGGIYNSAEGSVTIEGDSKLLLNVAVAGAAGKAGAKGIKGSGRNPGAEDEPSFNGNAGLTGEAGLRAEGGGIFNAGILTATDAVISFNLVAGASAKGGGIASVGGGSLTIDHAEISHNAAISLHNGATGATGAKGSKGFEVGEAGGDGEAGEVGGNGGSALGGGIYNEGDLTLRHSTLSGNLIASGNGGKGGNGGNGGNGAPAAPKTSDGYGGFYPGEPAGTRGLGAAGGAGGAAGTALGGGIFSTATDFTVSGTGETGSSTGAVIISDTLITKNVVKSGKAGKNGVRGLDGKGSAPDPGTITDPVGGDPGEELPFAPIPAGGGGLALLGGSLDATNLSVSLNKTAGYGGGISLLRIGSAIITSSRIELNKAAVSAGGLYVNADTSFGIVSTISTIIANNKAPLHPDSAGDFTSA